MYMICIYMYIYIYIYSGDEMAALPAVCRRPAGKAKREYIISYHTILYDMILYDIV